MAGKHFGPIFVSPDDVELTQDNLNKYRFFRRCLGESCRENNSLILYRGDARAGVLERLNETSLSSLFFFGDKAKHYFANFDKEGLSLRGINDCSADVLEFMFNEIGDVIYKSSLKEAVKYCTNSKFRRFFIERSNCNKFVSSILGLGSNIEMLSARDYYLYFLHAAETRTVSKETTLISTSTDQKVALKFAKGRKKKNECAGIVIKYFVPRPYRFHCISPLIVNEHHKIVAKVQLPTYQPQGIFPDEKEVAVKGALFPHFITSVSLLSEHKEIINPAILHLNQQDVENAVKCGLPVNQDDFEELINSTGYSGYVCSHNNGEFSQVDL